MSATLFEIGIFLAAGGLAGMVVGWLTGRLANRAKIGQINDDWQIKFHETARQRDRLSAENKKLRSTIEGQQTLVHKHQVASARSRTELESAREKLKSMAKDLFELGAIRDRLQTELRTAENTLATVRYQLADMETEFEKAGAFYKGELTKSFEKRRAVEAKIDDLKAECESLTNLLDASKSENESVTRALETAQRRLDNIDDIERNAIEFEAENAELRHNVSRMKLEIESLKREADELDALKMQNRELSHCLKSMENSRRQYEADAKRYREQAEQSEQLSDTLRVKLDDVERSMLEMADAQDQAQKLLRERPAEPEVFPQATVERDDLTRIVGIGKIFQQTLHELGIYSFRQIANFGPSDIARVNAALKDNRGRMEQDDWIGQAKELYFQKHSEMVEH